MISFRSIFGLVLAILAGLGVVYIDVVHLATELALVLIVDLHNLNLLHSIVHQFLLVFYHQLFANSKCTHLFRLSHSNHHIIQNEVRLRLYGFESLENVAVLFSIKVERMFRFELGLQLLDLIGSGFYPAQKRLTGASVHRQR